MNSLDEIGLPARCQHIGSYANAILAHAHHDTSSTSAPTISRMWTGHFLQRHPKYLIREKKTLDVKRKQVHDINDLNIWFDRYKSIRDEKGIFS